MKNNKNKKGFTLTEVLVVVLVISVLAAIAYPMYTRSITKSKAVEAINLLEMVRNKQLQKFARDHEYYTDLSKIGQLTSDASLVTAEGETLKVNGYVLSVNPDKNCMSAYYKKGNTEFTLSTSYETAGLGCSGDICKSFGDIVGSATDVCGCTKTCDNGFTLDQASCSCECNLGCATGGSCSSPSLSLPTTQSCGNGGSQTRVCTPSCNGGDCGAWGSCTSQTCEESLKPAASQSCGTCGTQSRTVSCNSSTGAWQTGTWSACTGCPAKTQCSATCPAGQKRDTSVIYEEDGDCCVSSCDASLQEGCANSGGTFYNTDCSCSCPSGKTWDSAKAACQCPSTMDQRCADNHYGPAGTFDSSSCTCSCPGGSVLGDEGLCECPSSKPQWSGGSCIAQADNCTDSTYAAAHQCECDPSIYNCCTQEEAQTREIIFDEDTRTCHCPDHMYLDGQAGCRCDESYIASHKSLCCPNEPTTNETCWKSNGKWVFVSKTEYRDCGGNYGDSGTCGSANPSGNSCPTIGATCETSECSWQGGGQDWTEQYSGYVTKYKCSGSGYSKVGW